jgi:hypothetical protein
LRLIPEFMETSKTYESYPIATVIFSNLVSCSIYILSLIILYNTWWLFFILYLGFILFLETRLIKNHCTSCYYWGKTCGFGKGRLSSLFFKKGDPLLFCNGRMSWKDMIPDLLISFIPVVVGIVLLIIDFDILLLMGLVLLILLTTAGNGFIRGKLTCLFCKQRLLGCPAEKLFNKEIQRG